MSNNNNNGGGGSSSSQHQAVVLRVNRFLEKKNKLTLADLAGIPTRYVNEDVCDREGHVITPSRHITAPLKQSYWFGKKLTGSVLKGMPWPKKPSLDCDEAEFQQASAFYKPLVKAKKLVQYKSDGRWEQTTRWSKSQGRNAVKVADCRLKVALGLLVRYKASIYLVHDALVHPTSVTPFHDGLSAPSRKVATLSCFSVGRS